MKEARPASHLLLKITVPFGIIYDIFVNCYWVATRWHSIVHIDTQTIHGTTQNKQ